MAVAGGEALIEGWAIPDAGEIAGEKNEKNT